MLDGAYRLFSTRDCAKTSGEEIARAVGLAKGSFCHFFSPKEELSESITKGLHFAAP
ncbi:MAG: helix-turn-helix domain-containing protein [Bacillota bacterium]